MILKAMPADFKVTELANIKLEQGKHSIFSMTKTNHTTEGAVQLICKALGLDRKRVAYAGTKDKLAVTRQFLSIERVNSQRIEKVDLNGIKLKHLGFSKRPLSLGLHQGNNFEIIVRNLDDCSISTDKRLINYFDEQRFSFDNHVIGKAIITKDFEKAATMLEKDYKYGSIIKNHLKTKTNDFVGAIKLIPLRILQIYLHSYQSYLWNKFVFNVLEEFQEVPLDLKLPLPGFDVPKLDSKYEVILNDLLNQEKLTERDFILRQFPKISLTGALRKVYVEAENLHVHFFDDELYEEKYAVKLDFNLLPGSYATSVIKQILNDNYEFRGLERISK